MGEPPPKERPILYKQGDHLPSVVENVFLDNGWEEWQEDSHKEDEWTIAWKCGRFKPSEYTMAKSYQKLNHFPKSGVITRKDTLVRAIRKMRAVHGEVFSFLPQSFILPSEYTKFVHEYSQQDVRDVWICKPADSSRGRKIFLMRDLSELTYDCQFVIQRYMENPLLISGYKWDMRVYVLVTHTHPLKAYIYQNGLIRFSTEKYDLGTLDNKFSHLTNSSINRYGQAFEVPKDTIGAGCKWTFDQLQDYFVRAGWDDRLLWCKIINIINMTLLSLPDAVPKNNCCFELFGFDILVDDQFKPWLLEVNCSPALSVDCRVDDEVKRDLVRDTIAIVMHPRCRELQYPPKKRPPLRRKGQEAREEPEEVELDPMPTGRFDLILPFSEFCEEQTLHLDASGKDSIAAQDAYRNIVLECKELDASFRKWERRDDRPGRAGASCPAAKMFSIDQFNAFSSQLRSIPKKSGLPLRRSARSVPASERRQNDRRLAATSARVHTTEAEGRKTPDGTGERPGAADKVVRPQLVKRADTAREDAKRARAGSQPALRAARDRDAAREAAREQEARTAGKTAAFAEREQGEGGDTPATGSGRPPFGNRFRSPAARRQLPPRAVRSGEVQLPRS
mmetsp:Transcript_40188/g.105480  ORF Transcript_40188/g.105480 Transcript_40188/m.105480 type:complete len:620 (+) Transcript_40188:96-1955(+)